MPTRTLFYGQFSKIVLMVAQERYGLGLHRASASVVGDLFNYDPHI
jgi:hypothetical protein